MHFFEGKWHFQKRTSVLLRANQKGQVSHRFRCPRQSSNGQKSAKMCKTCNACKAHRLSTFWMEGVQIHGFGKYIHPRKDRKWVWLKVIVNKCELPQTSFLRMRAGGLNFLGKRVFVNTITLKWFSLIIEWGWLYKVGIWAICVSKGTTFVGKRNWSHPSSNEHMVCDVWEEDDFTDMHLIDIFKKSSVAHRSRFHPTFPPDISVCRLKSGNSKRPLAQLAEWLSKTFRHSYNWFPH